MNEGSFSIPGADKDTFLVIKESLPIVSPKRLPIYLVATRAWRWPLKSPQSRGCHTFAPSHAA